MTAFAQPERCQLCGHTDRRDLRYRLAHWKDAEPGMAYQHIEACTDREACRGRVKAQKKPWPLIDEVSAA